MSKQCDTQKPVPDLHISFERPASQVEYGFKTTVYNWEVLICFLIDVIQADT